MSSASPRATVLPCRFGLNIDSACLSTARCRRRGKDLGRDKGGSLGPLDKASRALLNVPQSRALDIAGDDTTIQVHGRARSCVMGMEVGHRVAALILLHVNGYSSEVASGAQGERENKHLNRRQYLWCRLVRADQFAWFIKHEPVRHSIGIWIVVFSACGVTSVT